MKCENCGRPKGDHQAMTGHCPVGRKTRVWYTAFSKQLKFVQGNNTAEPSAPRCDQSLMSNVGCRRCTRTLGHEGECEFKPHTPAPSATPNGDIPESKRTATELERELALLQELDRISQLKDPHDYGLPLGDEWQEGLMIDALRAYAQASQADAEREIAELREELNSLEQWCNDSIAAKHVAELEREIAELRAQAEEWAGCDVTIRDMGGKIATLEAQNAELVKAQREIQVELCRYADAIDKMYNSSALGRDMTLLAIGTCHSNIVLEARKVQAESALAPTKTRKE